jgi:hypothetical protein
MRAQQRLVAPVVAVDPDALGPLVERVDPRGEVDHAVEGGREVLHGTAGGLDELGVDVHHQRRTGGAERVLRALELAERQERRRVTRRFRVLGEKRVERDGHAPVLEDAPAVEADIGHVGRGPGHGLAQQALHPLGIALGGPVERDGDVRIGLHEGLGERILRLGPDGGDGVVHADLGLRERGRGGAGQRGGEGR